ncbi:tetratricopeptide repeat protein [Geothrix oryzisoli]|uniref:tetratricopeptide repeat protein n=1 Tax=Geothrix oryzisoli TaxID=2922721 RepID=UPI001FACC8D9|nr:tetratricopeptide repeat protein [Geothrix oryzisoli]
MCLLPLLLLAGTGLAASAQSPAPAPAQAPAQGPLPSAAGTFEDARRHLVRGAAAIEMAKADSDLALAADEFKRATEIAPEWAFAWMNLGQVQARLGRLPEAMASYKRYLALAPNDKDAARIGDELIKLEFRMEQTARIQSRAGVWLGSGRGWWTATAEGNRLVLKCANELMSSTELDANTFWTDTPKPPQREFQLELQGTKVTGSSSRSEVIVGKCTVPAEVAEVTGTYDEAAGRLHLKFPRSRFSAKTSLNLFLDPVDCAGVTVLEKPTVEVYLHGPLPVGGIGAHIDTAYKPGAVLIRTEWSGHLGVTDVFNPAAQAAGLQAKDEILAIDGVKVAGLDPGEAVRRLYGVPGTEVTLSILHKKAKEPVDIKITRIKLSGR